MKYMTYYSISKFQNIEEGEQYEKILNFYGEYIKELQKKCAMSNFFDETMQGLLEAAEIAKGNITLTEWENMPAPTFYVADNV